MKLAWCSDIHLDSGTALNVFKDQLRRRTDSKKVADYDALLITGDISNGSLLVSDLIKLSEFVGDKKIYYVTGNHDYWGSFISVIDDDLSKLYKTNNNLVYLGNEETRLVKLNNDTCLIGHCGWYDARYGNAENTFEKTVLVDWTDIGDYKINNLVKKLENEKRYVMDYQNIVKISQRIAMQSAVYMIESLKQAIQQNFKKVYIATHVPPFDETSLYEGKRDSLNLCWFSSKIIGDLIVDFAKKHKDIQIISLSGHSHSFCELENVRGHNNLKALTSDACYGSPKITRVLDI